MEREIKIKAAAIGRVKIRASLPEIKVVGREEAGGGTWKGMHTAGSDGR